MKILLHTCCGVCAAHCVDLLLSEGHEVALFYSNANIYPHEEFLRRLEGVEKLAAHYKVPLIVDALSALFPLLAVAHGGCGAGTRF